MEALNKDLLTQDPDTVIPRESLSEVGYTGIRTISGIILEEANTKLRYPYFIKEVKEMLNDTTIATGINFQRQMLTRVKWDVVAPPDADDKLKERAKFIQSCMDDMDESWWSFISELSYYIPYGFSVHEKVFKRRLKRKGSRYNDGLIGWKKLAVRNQSTILKWNYSNADRKVESVVQSTCNLTQDNTYHSYLSKVLESEITIPREDFLLFTADSRLGDPSGNSPLKAIWILWRYRKELEKIQAIAAARDLEGIPKLTMPSSYMSDTARADQKALFEMFKSIAANFHQNAQAGLVWPSDVDEHTKQKLFDIELLTSDGGGKQQIEATINRINSQILMCLGADILALGSNGQGSFSLADAKTSLTALMLDYRLREIRDVLNNDLIKHTFVRNGWDTSVLPTFEYSDFDEPSLDELSKYGQRAASVGLLVKDLDQVNFWRRVQRIPELPKDTDVDELEFFGGGSRAGDGMASGSGGLNGTSNSVAGNDNSVSNSENV